MKLIVINILVLIVDVLYTARAIHDHSYIFASLDVICGIVLVLLTIYSIRELRKKKEQTANESRNTLTPH